MGLVRQVRFFGLLAVAVGVGIAVLAVHGAPPAWLGMPTHGLIDGAPGRPHAFLVAVLFLLLGWGLARRRAVALGTSVVLLCVIALNLRHVGYGLLFLAAAAGLALCYSRFPCVPERAQVHAAVRNGVVMLCAALLFGAAGLLHVAPHLDVATAALLITLVTLVTVMRAAPAPEPSDESERSRVRHMVARPGADTLAPFALRTDKTYLFSADGRAAVGYRVLAGVAVVGGDPVGDPDSYADVVARFRALCVRRGWRPAVLGARADLVPLWQGMRSVGFGDEVVLDVEPFGLATRRMRNVRQAVKRTYNAGVRTVVVPAADIPVPLRAEMAELSRQWLGSTRERGFSMILDGLFDDDHPAGVFVLAFADDELVGFQRYLPCGDADGEWALSLDVMRRTRTRLNGLNERMIVDVVEYARGHGAGRVSLNFAAFRELLDRGGSRGPVERVGYRVLHLLDPLIQVESLYLFNAKFRPGYVPRSVLLSSWLGLPATLFALLGLEFALPYDRRRHSEPDPVPVPAGGHPAAPPRHC
jgi:lysyl-tRNA synthetase class 2